VELSQSFVAEAIPNIAQKISAPGFGIKEFPILLLRKFEVAIDFAAAEAQIENSLPGGCKLGRSSKPGRAKAL
jgi:hypothetical protein